VVSINAFPPRDGTGTALLEAAVRAARDERCRRIVLTTTNDNVDALRFYQRRGLRLVALRAWAVCAARRLEPDIPATGAHGMALHDELELERRL
jgi:hypothetical protein